MDATSDIGFILRPLLARRGFSPRLPAAVASDPPVVPAPVPAADAQERAAALREARVHDAQVRQNMWLAALGGGVFL